MHAPESLELRRLALAVSVLDDVDMVPSDDGVLLPGTVALDDLSPDIVVTWLELRRALAGADPSSEHGRARIRSYLRGRRIAADVPAGDLQDRARPVGLPVDHPLHPGLSWVRHRVLGDALDLGLGFVGVGPDPDAVVVVPQEALDAAGVEAGPWWAAAHDYLERMGAIAATRLAGAAALRPIGDCDVATLLGSRALRAALVAADGTGMRAAAVPMLRRGWLDLTRIDPAFTAAAAAATSAEERGFSRPLLLTIDEVTLALPGGAPAAIVLRDVALDAPHLRPVLFR